MQNTCIQFDQLQKYYANELRVTNIGPNPGIIFEIQAQNESTRGLAEKRRTHDH